VDAADSVGSTAGYGMGWIVRLAGEAADRARRRDRGIQRHVDLLPDSDHPFRGALNTISALPSIAAQLVPQYLLGRLPTAASGAGDLNPIWVATSPTSRPSP
jgi:hypothetical protein